MKVSSLMMKTECFLIYGLKIVSLKKHKKINSMKSRIFKAVLAVVAPLVIEFIVKKISEKLDKKSQEAEPKKLPA